MRRSVQRWCLRSTACCSCCGSSVRRWVRRIFYRSASAQCGCTALTEPRQPLDLAAQADPGLRSKVFDRDAIIKMPTDQTFPTERCQAGIGVAMHSE